MTLRRVDPHEPHGRVYHAIARFSTTKVGGWLSKNVAWKIDPYLLKLTRGRISTALPLRAGLLESRGARTGLERRHAILYFHDGESVIIVASLRGWPTNPAWYYNIKAHPDVRYGGESFRAEIVRDSGERERLWKLADLVFPPYADYREQAGKAGRVIPIVRLVPTDGSDAR